MFTSPFFRRLFIPSLLLIVFATATLGFVAAGTVRATYIDRQTESLRQNVRLLSHAIAPRLADPPALNDLVKQLGAATATRVTVIRADGVVVADSEADVPRMENHRQRPEFADAINLGEGIASRPSDTLKTDLLYLAQPVQDLAGQAIPAAPAGPFYVRAAVHLTQLQHNLNLLYAGLATAAALAAVVAGAVSFVLARRSARPITELTEFADALSRGDLHRRALRSEKGEISTLATSLNSMAGSLARLIDQTAKDKAELLTILSSMSEGVIATDRHQKILLVNDAAGQLLNFDPVQAVGKHLWHVVRNEPIIKAAEEVLSRAERKLISVGPVSARQLDVTLCTFPTEGPAQGLVLVAHDITQSFQYQELRKEFVANVSHELRTPLSVIKGFVETLQDGAWLDQRKAPEYLATIHRHTEQLTNLVSDLLELAKLENQGGQGIIARRAPMDVALVIHKAFELLVPAAQKKSQSLTSDVASDLPDIKGNADYLERAVANLIDNASKYTPEGGKIHVTAHYRTCQPKPQSAGQPHSAGAIERPAPPADAAGTNGAGAIIIEVTDNGIGIPKDDIPRVFERFYRVDRSRSREMGGTGLGLSIVKHVAQAHNGAIEVDSAPGKGSTFRLKLPV